MKKVLLGLCLLIGSNVFAQSGKIRLINTHPTCDVVVTLHAREGAFLPCAITTNLIIVPASTTLGAWDPISMGSVSGPGYATPASYTPCSSGCGTFRWTDADFYFRCPSGCTEPGRVSETSTANCFANPLVWFAPTSVCITTGTPPNGNARWLNFAGPVPMANIDVRFQ